ncbi:MAG TPA: glycosyltransferase [Acidimicrobiales bacterium]|nr:glycosyltransferase [Acidimicrobiales bacterium]
MRISFVLGRPVDNGGQTLATARAAVALTEAGHRCEVLIAPGSELPNVATREIEPLAKGASPQDVVRWSRELAKGQPDLVVVPEGRAERLLAATRVGPTLLHCQMHWPVCPDAARYWGRLGRECSVKAGWKCLVLRPALGCSGMPQAIDPKLVSARKRLVEVVAEKEIGVLCISGPQHELLNAQGLEPSRLAVLPNLGMRLSSDALRSAASSIPISERSVVAFIGRLNKEKGAALLPEIRSGVGPATLAVYGDGYLKDALRAQLGASLRGPVSQNYLAGVLQWARAFIFPSLWPEPGGIVGIDARLFGVPVGAFEVGAAMDWPGTEYFRRGQARAMGEWAGGQDAVDLPRPAEPIAAAQEEYWRCVGRRGDRLVREFLEKGRFVSQQSNAVHDDLHAALKAADDPSAGDVGSPGPPSHRELHQDG